MIRYRRVAATVARRSFDPFSAFDGEEGAELRILVSAFADPEDAAVILEEGKSSRRLANLRKAMELVLTSYITRGMHPPLKQTDVPTYFRFFVVETDDDTDEVRALRARLRNHHAMLETLRALDPDDFELLCGRVLQEIGCEAVHVTRSSQDLGADFMGRTPAAAAAVSGQVAITARVRTLRNIYLTLFGQAKRYAEYRSIDLDTVKMVEGTWNDLVRRKMDGILPKHLDDGLADIGFRAGDAVQLMFITSSRFTQPAQQWSTTAGMATLDGDQLAQLLLEAGIGVDHDSDGNALGVSEEALAAAYKQ